MAKGNPWLLAQPERALAWGNSPIKCTVALGSSSAWGQCCH